MSTAQQKRWDTGLLSVHVTQTKVLIGVITIEPSGIPSVYMTGDRQNVYHCQLSLSLSLTHTHTHIHARAHTHVRTHTLRARTRWRTTLLPSDKLREGCDMVHQFPCCVFLSNQNFQRLCTQADCPRNFFRIAFLNFLRLPRHFHAIFSLSYYDMGFWTQWKTFWEWGSISGTVFFVLVLVNIDDSFFFFLTVMTRGDFYEGCKTNEL